MFNVKKYYFFAHKAEARVYIDRLKLLPSEHTNIYTNGALILAITGMGAKSVDKLKQTFALYPPTKDAKIINIGIAGCSDESVAIGTVFKIGTLYFNNSALDLNGGASCHSFNEVQKDKFAGFLCDMEGFFIASEAVQYIDKENIKVYKVVSDHLKDATIPNKTQLNEWIQKVYKYEYSSSNGS